MRIRCLQENLKTALRLVRRAVGRSTTFPALHHILISAEQGQVRLTATNLEMSIVVVLAARVDEDGAILVPPRRMINIVDNLANGLCA